MKKLEVLVAISVLLAARVAYSGEEWVASFYGVGGLLHCSLAGSETI